LGILLIDKVVITRDESVKKSIEMAGFNVNPIDLSNLETELHFAIEEDKTYKREDAAKFRAVEQSKTYEEFR
jgi:hypothetical protein